jgi:hypothetical protein
MKTLTLIACFFLSLSLVGQSVECGGAGTATIENIECTDDYITFMVTGTGTESNSAQFHGIPSNSSINYGFGFNSYNDGETFAIGTDFPNLAFNMPSGNCAPLVLNLTILSNAPCSELLTINPNMAPIPTLGQWALIILAFLFTIFGVVQIRRRVALS